MRLTVSGRCSLSWTGAAHGPTYRPVWVCPEGKTLYKMSQSKPPGHTLYMVNAYACRKCPRHGALCKTKTPSIVDSREDSLLNRVKAYAETGAAKERWSIGAA